MARKKKSSSNRLEVQNATKTLFANIGFMSPDLPIHTIVMTSSVPSEGKSTTSIELARAIASSGKSVLLVEADMRRRSLANYLGVRAQAGVYSVLTNAVPLERAILSTKINNLSFLDAEPNIPNPVDIVSSKSYERLVNDLEKKFDYVIFDTAPVGTFVEGAILSGLVDGTILVVRVGMTKRAELQHAYEQLKKAKANILGTCATFCEESSNEYYYAYYTKEGRRVEDNFGSMPSVSNGAGSRRVSGGQGADIPTSEIKGGR